MSVFGFNAAPSSQSEGYGDIVARYQRLRPLRSQLNNELVSRLSRDVLQEGAKRLGMLHRGTLVFDSEGDMSVLMDYCIYDVYRKGRNAVDQYLCDVPPDPDSEEAVCLAAMQHANYAFVVVLRVERGVGCHVQNLFTEETRLLVDMGFSQSAERGVVVATRLLDYGDYVTTTGTALPVGVIDDDELDDLQREFSTGRNDNGFDPAPVIRECLQRGASSNVQYEEIGGQGRPAAGTISPPAGNATQRKRALVKRRAGKAVTNRRCRCGSGKMFKNCCGKR